MHAASGTISSGFSDLAVPFGVVEARRKGKQMKKTALILALAVAAPFTLPVWAQDKPAEQPAEKAAVEKPAAPAGAQSGGTNEAAKAEAPKKPMTKRHSRRMEDARHCLDEPTNTEIIKCAEAYL